MPLTAKTPSGQGLRTALDKRDLRRVHRFIFRGKRIVYDMNSCAPFEVDRITWDVLAALGNGRGAHEHLYRKHGQEAVLQVADRLQELKAKGSLFSRFEPRPPAPCSDTALLVLLPTYACNLDCRYCYAKEEPYAGQRALMDIDTARKAIDFFIRQSGQKQNLCICFFGGEPLLNFPAIRQAIEYAKAQGRMFRKTFEFSLTTNAVLLTREKQRFLNENDVLIVASLDGPQALHDSQRPSRNGNGSHAAALAHLQEVLQARGPYGICIRSTFTRHTIHRLSDVAAYILGLGFRDLSLEPALLPADHQDAIRVEDLPLVRQAYAAAAERYLQELLNRNLFLLTQFSSVVRRLRSPGRCFAHCGPGYSSMAVSPRGEVYPCIKLVEMSEFRLGDVDDPTVNRRVQKLLQSAHVQNKKKCGRCWAKYLCGGGCHADGLKYDRDLFGAHDVKCGFTKCWFELGMWLYATLSKSAPDALASVLELESGRRKLASQERVAPVP